MLFSVYFRTDQQPAHFTGGSVNLHQQPRSKLTAILQHCSRASVRLLRGCWRKFRKAQHSVSKIREKAAQQHPYRQTSYPQQPERRSERPKHVSTRHRLVDKYAINIRPERAKERLCVPIPCLTVVGCYSFAPFGGVALLLPLPGRCPGLFCKCPFRGVNLRFAEQLPFRRNEQTNVKFWIKSGLFR